MKFVRFLKAGQACLGVQKEEHICDLAPVLAEIGAKPATELENLMAQNLDFKLLSQKLDKGKFDLPAEKMEFLSPIANPNKILCLALNYHSHIEEVNREHPSKPYVFLKAPTSLIGHKQTIYNPKGCKSLSFEAELAVVIGKEGKGISREKALDHVFGYTIMNDMSARDIGRTNLSKIEIDWYCTKSFDGSGPLGPCVVTRDEIADPNDLDITLSVNGVVKQDGNTSLMIYQVPQLIEFVSENNTLKTGDIIATGTLGGAKGTVVKGDVITIVLEGVGVLENTVE
ncbi:MAG: fumarylacetoacetate hydrolase family protein [Deltaproteobacteria bacterium]|jgi:acylpyruvate hydrolase|nr:fumarylacetoacetate hydrolase family protein [Deltaproteobacteria bacterium]